MTLAEHRAHCAARFREVSAEIALVRERWRTLVTQREQLRGALALLQDLAQTDDGAAPAAERGLDDAHRT